MKNDRFMLKNRIGNILFIVYIIWCITLLILHIPDSSNIMRMTFFIGAIMGLSTKILIIVVFWKTIVTKYIKKDNKINVMQLTVGAFLIMLILSSIVSLSIDFIETYIIISIVMILKNDYHIFRKTDNF